MDRISWNQYFILTAHVASLRSTCERRQVGAVIVKDKRVVSTGYNGTASGTKECQGVDFCTDGRGFGCDKTVHAEANAMLFASRHDMEGATMYTTLSPCSSCLRKIINAGIKEVIYDEEYRDDTIFEMAEEAGVKLTQIQSAYAILTPEDLYQEPPSRHLEYYPFRQMMGIGTRRPIDSFEEE